MKLHNTLSRQVDDFEPINKEEVKIYSCGPTVYDHIHIGNLRSVIIFDVLYRLLLHLNVKVNYIQNITDIDDKIIAKAEKEKKSEKKTPEFPVSPPPVSFWISPCGNPV